MDIWFIRKTTTGLFYSGSGPGGDLWIDTRKGAVTFRSRAAAEARIAELGLLDAEPVEF